MEQVMFNEGIYPLSPNILSLFNPHLTGKCQVKVNYKGINSFYEPCWNVFIVDLEHVFAGKIKNRPTELQGISQEIGGWGWRGGERCLVNW